MNNTANEQIELVKKMRRHGRQIVRQELILPDWITYTVSVLVGLGFVLLVEFGVLALVVVPAVLLVLAIHYRQVPAKPYFWATRKGLTETKNERLTDPAYVGFIIFGLSGLIALPFLLIKALEYREVGYTWASYTGGAILAGFVLLVIRLDNHFLRKTIVDE